jgi:hypothetical protein
MWRTLRTNNSGGAAVHGGLTGVAFDPVVRHLLYEPKDCPNVCSTALPSLSEWR